jgi:hypothetical protein
MALVVNEARLLIEFKAVPMLVDYTAHLLLRQGHARPFAYGVRPIIAGP